MIHKEFWGILLLVFVGWTFWPGQPSERIAHACRPLGWAGNLATSVASLVVPNSQQSLQGWFDRFEYGCSYSVWRLIYQDDYNAEQAAKLARSKPPAVAGAASGAASRPASAHPPKGAAK